MVVTMLEATVDMNKWEDLKEVFRKNSVKKPDQMKDGFLIQSRENPNVWCLLSVWKSKEGLDEYRKSVDVPGGVLMLRSVGAEPKLRIFDVAD